MSATTLPLDRVQVSALRKCDRVVFRHYNGQSTIEAIKEANKTAANPFSEEQRIDVPCHTRWTDYTRGHGYGSPESFQGFDMIHSAKYHDTWRTIANLIQPGDLLTLHWIRAPWQETETIRTDAGPKYDPKPGGFVKDQINLVVTRGKDHDKTLTFHLEHTICPEDSTARAIRNVRYKEREPA
jgi:hypothetical protein